MRTCLGTAFLLVAVLLQLCPNADAQERRSLDHGPPASRQFRAGDRHSYSLNLPANQTVEIVCEQKGVDVVMTALDPAGKTVSVSSAPDSFAGSERLVFISNAAGVHRIDVESGRPGTADGTYEISVRAKNHPTENDVIRTEAMKLLAEARGLVQTSADRFQRATQAANKLEHAVSLFEKANDSHGMATALFHLATIVANEFGDEVKAISHYERAIQIWRKLDDQAGTAAGLAYAARELVDKGDHEEALTFLNEALTVNRKLNDNRGGHVFVF